MIPRKRKEPRKLRMDLRGKKPAKRSRKAIVRELDRVFSLYIRARDGNKCVLCGKTTNVQCGHILSRTSYGTRWDEANAAAQCAGCNCAHEYTPYPFIKWAIEHIGHETLNALQQAWNKPHKFADHELEELTRTFRAKLASIGGAS